MVETVAVFGLSASMEMSQPDPTLPGHLLSHMLRAITHARNSHTLHFRGSKLSMERPRKTADMLFLLLQENLV